MIRWFCITPVLIVAACAPTETGNPEFAAQMALTAESTDAARVSLGVPGGSQATVEQAWVVVGDIRFVRADVCDSIMETEVDVVGPGAIDLAAGPEILPFDIMSDDYCRVRVRIERATAVVPGAPPEIVDHSYVIVGTLPDGTPFRLASQLNRDADVRSRAAPFPLDEARRAVLLSFDAAGWLEDVDFATATREADGSVVIDETQNDAQLDAFDAAVHRAMRLFRDGDEDGELDVEDRAELLAEGAP